MDRNFGNWRTSLLGVLAGGGVYLQGQGLNLPQNRAGWINLAVGLIISLLGYFAKDAATGSRPGETR